MLHYLPLPLSEVSLLQSITASFRLCIKKGRDGVAVFSKPAFPIMQSKNKNERLTLVIAAVDKYPT